MDVSVRSTTHTLLSREIAAASTVLLKNNHTSERGLPLSAASAIKSIAIIGKDALMPNLNCGENNQCNDGTMTIG
jgi:beta-glucosidase